LAKNAENLADKDANRKKQLLDYEFQLESHNRDLESKRLDAEANLLQEAAYVREYETKMAEYAEKLKAYDDSRVITAPEDSVVTKLFPNKGQYVNANTQLASFGLSTGYVVECEISSGNNFVAAGDVYKMSNADHTIRGTVTKVTPTDRGKAVTISIPEEGVTAGETFDITFEKTSAESFTLVPNGTIGKDGDGYYLNQIKRRDGMLGKEFYTEKLRVTIGDFDASNTAITRGVTFPEPVVLISDKPFADGETIKIRNAGDFFAD
jgi:multidrug efflux pump subunit AcrA (membrane-fusion protein)